MDEFRELLNETSGFDLDADKINEIGPKGPEEVAPEEEEFTPQTPEQRMDGLVDQRAIDDLEDACNRVAQSLLKEGFEGEDILPMVCSKVEHCIAMMEESFREREPKPEGEPELESKEEDVEEGGDSKKKKKDKEEDVDEDQQPSKKPGMTPKLKGTAPAHDNADEANQPEKNSPGRSPGKSPAKSPKLSDEKE
jgi:hypothetical protein